MKKALIFIAFIIVLLLFTSRAYGAFPFYGTPGMFDPQISVVNSGALLDVSAVVSADRKYVTMTMRPQLSTVVAMNTFNFQNGFVGIPVVNGYPQPSPLNQVGMIRIGN